MFINFRFPISILKYKLRKFNLEKTSKRVTSKEYLNYVNQINSDGYCIIKNFYNKSKCDQIIELIEQKLLDSSIKIVEDETKSDQRILFSEKISQEVHNFFNNEFIFNIGELYTKMKLKKGFTLMNKVKFQKNNIGSGGGWHKDAYYSQFKSILYLNDVDNENGPFQLVEKSNKLLKSLKISYKLKKGYPNTRFSEKELEKIKNKKIKSLEGFAGTLILFDGSLIHRGSPVKNGTRYALTNYYFPENSYDDLILKFKKSINE